jgi:hypothetical protein
MIALSFHILLHLYVEWIKGWWLCTRDPEVVGVPEVLVITMVETKLLDWCTWQNSDRSWGQVFESIIQCIYGCDGSGYTDNWGVWSSKSYKIANLVGNGNRWECASSHQNLLPNRILQVDMLGWASCHTCPLCVPRIWQCETNAFECGMASKVGMFL